MVVYGRHLKASTDVVLNDYSAVKPEVLMNTLGLKCSQVLLTPHYLMEHYIRLKQSPKRLLLTVGSSSNLNPYRGPEVRQIR